MGLGLGIVLGVGLGLGIMLGVGLGGLARGGVEG